VKKTNKLAGFVAGFAALSLVVAACGGSSGDSNEGAAFTSLEACATRTYDYTAPESTSAGMTITYDIAPEAVWEDGSPITVTLQGNLGCFVEHTWFIVNHWLRPDHIG